MASESTLGLGVIIFATYRKKYSKQKHSDIAVVRPTTRQGVLLPRTWTPLEYDNNNGMNNGK